MRETVINCYIDKLIRTYPHISEYVALANIWVRTLSIKSDATDKNNALLCDDAVMDLYFSKLLNFYGIKATTETGAIDNFICKGIPVFVYCDNFYLPYHEDYKKKHSYDHIVLIETKNESEMYYVVDEIPAFEGWLDEEIINEIHQSGGCNIIWHEYINGPRIHTTYDEMCYLMNSIKDAHFSNEDLFDGLIKSNLSKFDKLDVIIECKDASLSYNGLYRIALKLKNEYGDICQMDPLITCIEAYLNSWLLIINMARKGVISCNDAYFDRIVLRIVQLLENEKAVNKSLENLKNHILPTLLPYIAQKGGKIDVCAKQ